MCRAIFGQYQCCQLIKGIPEYRICARNKSGEAWNCKPVHCTINTVMSDKFILAKRVPAMCCLCGRKRIIKKNKNKAADLLREVRRANRARSNRARPVAIPHELVEVLISVKKACQQQITECEGFGLLLDTLAELDMPPEFYKKARRVVNRVESYAKEDYKWVDDEAKATGIPPKAIEVPSKTADKPVKEICESLKSEFGEPIDSGGDDMENDEPDSPTLEDKSKPETTSRK